jgi:hypothetical protein
MQNLRRFRYAQPSIQDLWDAATSGDWSACDTATEEDLLRPLEQAPFDPPPTAVYMAFETKRLHRIPSHLRTQRVLDSLWDPPSYYACSIMREFELSGVVGDWGELEPMLVTADNACRPVNGQGQTSLHIAALHRHLHKVPRQMLTLRGMFIPDRTAMTPMSLADNADLEKLTALLTGDRAVWE